MNKNRIEELKVLAETQYLSLYDAKYTNKGGKEKHWMIASRKKYDVLKSQYFQNKEEKIDAVIICSLHKESNKLVLIKQYRIPLNDYVYELPAGLVDAGEDMEKTLKRELKEETGLNLTEIIKSTGSEQVYVSSGMTDESVAFVYCLCEGTPSNEYLEEDEDIEIVLVSREEAKSLLKSKVKMDIKALMALESFVRIGKEMFKEL